MVGKRESFHRYIRGIILLGFAMLLFKLLITGNMENFIAPKMIKFVYFTFIVSLVLGSVQVWHSGDGKQHSCECDTHSLPKTTIGSFALYALFLFPITGAFLFADATLDGKVAAKRGVALAGIQQGKAPDDSIRNLLSDAEEEADEATQEPPADYYEKLEKQLLRAPRIEVRDENYISIMDVIGQDVQGFKGKEITFTGFVHREDDLGQDTIVIARYGIACCVADASVLGMLAVGADVAALKEGEWIEVTGILGETTYVDTLLPIVQIKQLEKISAPNTPYVYQNF